MSLNINVHELTREHLTNGPAGLVTMPALLDQLADAVTAETRAGSAGSGGTSLPIGEGALAKLQDIDREARTEHLELYGTDAGELKAIIQGWAVDSINGEWTKYLEDLTKRWLKEIRAIVTPTKPPSRRTLPCPACGTLFHEGKAALAIRCWAEDETMLKVWEWTAECSACDAEWVSCDEMAWLIRAIHADTPSDVGNNTTVTI